MFNRFDLETTIESNLVKTDFLDVELDLCNDTYAPYTENQISKRHMSISNKTILNMLLTKYQNPSTKG